MATFDVVIPTIGRPTLARLLRSLDAQDQFAANSVVIVDDREWAGRPLQLPTVDLQCPIVIVRGGGRGPAAARNRGIEQSTAEWVAFLDDDVIVPSGWAEELMHDLEACPERTAATQANIRVPRADATRRATDWERNVRGLEHARWATADMAFRRAALVDVDGFDERFPRAFREDADLALRLLDAGYDLKRGSRTVVHPIGAAAPGLSLRLQRGNADDPLMRALHGPDWRRRSGAHRGRRRRHLATTAAGVVALLGLAAGRRNISAATALTWAGLTAELAWTRIAPGPRTRLETVTMAWTSVLMPPVATWWWLHGVLRARRLVRDGERHRLHLPATQQRRDDAVVITTVDRHVEQVR